MCPFPVYDSRISVFDIFRYLIVQGFSFVENEKRELCFLSVEVSKSAVIVHKMLQSHILICKYFSVQFSCHLYMYLYS